MRETKEEYYQHFDQMYEEESEEEHFKKGQDNE